MDKLTIRLEAVKLAVMNRGESTSDIIRNAEIIEKYIIGDIELPDYNDPNSLVRDMMERMNRDNEKRMKETSQLFRKSNRDLGLFLQEDDEKVN